MKNKKGLFLLNQSGQAAIEYILLLIVMVSMLFALKGVFTSMNTFMSDFMGGYIVCLMEYGELPSLGVQNTDLKKHTTGSDGKKCEFRKFSATVAAVSDPGGGTGGGSSGSGSGSGSGSSTSSGSKKSSSNSENSGAKAAGSGSSGKSGKDGDSASDSSSGGSSSSSSRGGSRSKKGSPYTQGQINRGGGYATADGADSGNDKVKVLDDEGKKKDKDRLGMNSSRSSRRGKYDSSKYNAITGNMAEEIEKKSNKTERKPSSTVMQMTEDGYRFMPYKKTFTPPKTEKYVEEKKDEDMGFGKFIKWLIIAGILIACFILFGGQIMNYSNSSE